MSKAVCSKCGFEVLLEGKERWTISEAIKFLLDKQKNHNCIDNLGCGRKGAGHDCGYCIHCKEVFLCETCEEAK